MENASKALLISGGILFALLTLSLVAVMINNINTMESAKDEAQVLEQLSKFNAQYEVFNKDKLYGTEVITAVNKAVENNYKQQSYGSKSDVWDNKDEDWYINVKLDLGTNEKFYQTIKRIKEDDPRAKMEIVTNKSDIPSEILVQNISGHLELIPDSRVIEMNQKFLILFDNKNHKNAGIKASDGYTYYRLSWIESFKTRIFKGEVHYNDQGRIDEITFTLQKQ